MIEKEVEYSKEIDSNSSFSVFQSAWMSACLKVERHKCILLELRLPLGKAAGSFGDPPPSVCSPGDKNSSVFAGCAENSGRLIPGARGLPSEPEFSSLGLR